MQSLSMVSVSLADAISFHRNSKKGGKVEIAISKYIICKTLFFYTSVNFFFSYVLDMIKIVLTNAPIFGNFI